MRRHTWAQAKPKPAPKPKISDEVRHSVETKLAPILINLKKRIPKRPASSALNRPEDVFLRWHRNALYLVVIMRTPHGRPPTFESHVARMEHAGDGKFDFAVPMRRGWNTGERSVSVDRCATLIEETVYF